MNFGIEKAYHRIYEQNGADFEKMTLKGHLLKIQKIIDSSLSSDEKVQMISNLYKMFIKPEDLEK